MTTSMPPPPPEQSGASNTVGVSETDRDGMPALVLGIIGCITGIVAPVALYVAARGRRRAEEAGVEPSGKLQAGWILAWIGIVVLIGSVVVTIVNLVTG